MVWGLPRWASRLSLFVAERAVRALHPATSPRLRRSRLVAISCTSPELQAKSRNGTRTWLIRSRGPVNSDRSFAAVTSLARFRTASRHFEPQYVGRITKAGGARTMDELREAVPRDLLHDYVSTSRHAEL